MKTAWRHSLAWCPVVVLMVCSCSSPRPYDPSRSGSGGAAGAGLDGGMIRAGGATGGFAGTPGAGGSAVSGGAGGFGGGGLGTGGGGTAGGASGRSGPGVGGSLGQPCSVQSDCPGSCSACSDGICASVLNVDDPDSCGGTCDAHGACKSKQGQTCQTGSGCVAGTTCAPDGYCCNTACTNSCQACDIPGFLGICTPVAAGPPHGNRVLCAGAGSTCGGVCTNKPDGTCSYPSAVTTCGIAKTCASGAVTGGGTCNGEGQCASTAQMSCPNGCNAAGTDCLTCTAGSVACSGQCCSAGQSCCGGLCLDTSSNPNACGNSCTTCPTPNRAIPTCVAGVCGTSCVDGAPKCSDGSCSRSSWTFDSLDLDGVAVTSGATTYSVRSLSGNMALAADTPGLSTINVTVPICRTGTLDATTKTFSFRAYLDGVPFKSPDQPANFFLSAYAPGPTDGFLGLQSVWQGVWNTYSAPISMSSSRATTDQITITVGSFGGAFSGTVWIDDITIN